MSAMSIEEQDMREGELDLFAGVWYCTEHSASVKVGRECAFCVHDLLGAAGFDRWADAQVL